jgi:hypothetical protein
MIGWTGFKFVDKNNPVNLKILKIVFKQRNKIPILSPLFFQLKNLQDDQSS